MSGVKCPTLSLSLSTSVLATALTAGSIHATTPDGSYFPIHKITELAALTRSIAVHIKCGFAVAVVLAWSIFPTARPLTMFVLAFEICETEFSD